MTSGGTGPGSSARRGGWQSSNSRALRRPSGETTKSSSPSASNRQPSGNSGWGTASPDLIAFVRYSMAAAGGTLCSRSWQKKNAI